MNSIVRLSERLRLLSQSFQAKLMLTLVLPLLVIWGFVLFSSASMKERQQKFVGDQQVTTVKRLADELDEKIKDRLTILEAVASGLDAEHLSAPNYATIFLTERYALRPLFPSGVIIYDRSGTALGDYPTVEGRKGSNSADREYLQRLYATGKPNVSQPFMGRVLKKMLVNLCVPIAGSDQQIKGAVCGNIDVKATNLLGRLSDPQAMGNNDVFLIAASNRVLIASTDSRRVMQQLPDNPLMQQLMTASGKAFVAKNVAGVEKLYADASVAVADWVLVLGLATETAYAPIQASLDVLLKEAVLASLLVLLTAFFLARRMLRPLQLAGQKMDAMSSGHEPLQRVDETGDSEVRSLLTSFNRLTETINSQRLQMLVEQDALKVATKNLHELNQNLESAVAARTQEFQDLYDQSPCGYHSLSPDGVILRVNKTELTLLGYAKEEFIGHRIEEFLSQESQHKFRESFPRFLQTGKIRNIELDFVCKDGSVRPCLVDGDLIKDASGQTFLTNSTLVDNTERKRKDEQLKRAVEAAEAANLAKSNFLANMSHELRTPLNGVIGFSEFLIDEKIGKLVPKQKEYLHDILNSGRHLLELINDVLDLSKVEAGKMELYPETFSVTQSLEEVCSVVAPMAQKKNIVIRQQVDPAVDKVTLDAQKFTQVLLNLLSNAIKFTDTGGTVDVVTSLHDDAWLHLEIKDTGIGIKREDLGKLFAEFEQLDSTLARRYQGTGLGLALTKKIVEFQQGTISVQSEVGKGSTFTVVLPRVSQKVTA